MGKQDCKKKKGNDKPRCNNWGMVPTGAPEESGFGLM